MDQICFAACTLSCGKFDIINCIYYFESDIAFWNLPGPDNYALQYADGVQTYITESNRLDIKNGCILRLTKAPGRCAEDLYKGIQSSDSGVRCDSLKELASVSTDVTFAQEFISRDGHLLLVKIVEDSNESNAIMTHTLTGFMELMDHGIVSWENLSCVFIKKVRSVSVVLSESFSLTVVTLSLTLLPSVLHSFQIASFVNAKSTDVSMQQVSLDILESMVLSSHSLFLQVKQEVTMERLIAHLQVTNPQIQTKAMALLMALLQTAGDSDRQDMFAFLNKKNLRQYIYKNIIHSSGSVQDKMAHYLYVLQSVTLNQTGASHEDASGQLQPDVLHGLRQAAFETESENSLSHERRRSLCAKEFKKLGFSNNSNPGQDLVRTPPGLLALDTMFYFASRYPDAYSRFVLENSSREDKHECPFARSSIQLTLVLCEILRIGEPPSETRSDYHPIFFSQDRLMEELFCVCIQLLNKTWKEMRATQEDFDKVMQVVREQITRTLSSKPTSLELFKNKVNALNYSEILKLRQTERLHQEETLAPPYCEELKERLKPELLELIRQQRLNRLCQGTMFRKISNRRRQDKLWYCRLSPNHKMLHYGDVEEDTDNPPIETLQEKIPVADIKGLLTGKDCPHMKENKGKQNKFCLWTDGLSVLLGREMSSESMRSELEILLSMEIKLRLLDLENVPIPDYGHSSAAGGTETCRSKAGEVEVLQPVEVRCSLSHSAVADARAVAQGQAGEAAAVPGHRGQAGVRDLRQHGERKAAQVWVTQHLRRGETVLSPAFLHQTKTFGSPPPPTWVMLLSVSLGQAERSSSCSLFRANRDAPACCLNCCRSFCVTSLGFSSKGKRGGLKKPMLPKVRQTPICDFFTQAQPQNHQPLQLTEGIPQKLCERENCKILKTETTLFVQLLRLSVSSCARAVVHPVRPFTISVPLTCRHSDRSRLLREDTDITGQRELCQCLQALSYGLHRPAGQLRAGTDVQPLEARLRKAPDMKRLSRPLRSSLRREVRRGRRLSREASVILLPGRAKLSSLEPKHKPT
ncbi:hypothetical protein F7725_022545 [Dissostichus mawsoni]|uniref:ELMO domain-containing protein n=1 Tax=Dissostichus mawsoni TaxID=36200 RepID=A0A7J5YYE5_DISMA|nr:hypothetical protein F7725_022545 [Dissostichus mawsoni]